MKQAPARCVLAIISAAFSWSTASAQTAAPAKGVPGQADRKFAQLGTELPTPTATRTASGAPGRDYWQQRANYRIKVSLDEKEHRITAAQTISYVNGSPDSLTYLWLQLDQNIFADGSIARPSETAQTAGARRNTVAGGDSLTYEAMRRHQAFQDREYGFEMGDVTAGGVKAATKINDTMMRVELPVHLAPGASVELAMTWAFNIPDDPAVGTRGGFEHFAKNDTYLSVANS